MTDIEKVIKGLECCNNRNDCKQCPYATEYDPNLDCLDKTRADAIELLKEQQAEIKRLKSERNCCEDCYHYENCDMRTTYKDGEHE